MATTFSASKVSGYPTDNAMKVSVSFQVTWAGNYTTCFEVYTSKDDALFDTYWGATYAMEAGGSKSNLTKTLGGLTPGTSYYVICYLWDADDDEPLDTSAVPPVTITFTTTGKTYSVTITYYNGSSNTEDEGDPGESLVIRSSPPGNPPSGYEFMGWSKSTNSIEIDYEGGDTVSAASSNISLTLYAVFRKNIGTVVCYFGVNKASQNERTKYQWLYNTSKTGTAQAKYSLSGNLPSFSSGNKTITTSSPAVTWTAIGWRDDTSADDYEYKEGASVSGSDIASVTAFYAVYSREVTISYEANGGSGSTSDSTGKAYYNTSNNFKAAEITLKRCGFSNASGGAVFEFLSWNTASDGTGTSRSPGATRNIYVDETYYAIWKENRIEIDADSVDPTDSYVAIPVRTFNLSDTDNVYTFGVNVCDEDGYFMYSKDTSYKFAGPSYNTTIHLYNLDHNTTYVVEIYIKANGEATSFKDSIEFTTDERVVSGTITTVVATTSSSVTTSRVNVDVSVEGYSADNLEATPQSFYVTVSLSIDSGSKQTSSSFTLSVGATETVAFKFSGLPVNTDCDIYVSLYQTGVLSPVESETHFIKTAEAGPPTLWEWPITVRKNAPVETKKQADGNYYAYFLTADNWNDFLFRIDDFGKYCSRTPTASLVSVATASANTEMKLVQLNAARGLVAEFEKYMTDEGKEKLPDSLTEKSTITAQYLLNLADALNSIVTAKTQGLW